MCVHNGVHSVSAACRWKRFQGSTQNKKEATVCKLMQNFFFRHSTRIEIFVGGHQIYQDFTSTARKKEDRDYHNGPKNLWYISSLQSLIIGYVISAGVDLKKASKTFAQHFSCGSAVTGDDEIVIQGDISYDLSDFIQQKWPEVNRSRLFNWYCRPFIGWGVLNFLIITPSTGVGVRLGRPIGL